MSAPVTDAPTPDVATTRKAGRLSPLRRAWTLWYVVVGFAIVIALVASTGASLDLAIAGWFKGAFGTGFNLVQTLTYATPIALVALGVAAALKAGIIVVGAEGQMIVGAIAATVFSLTLGDALPAFLALPLGALVGVAGGTLWALLPAVARAYWGVNEILFTLLMNYIAVFLLTYLLRVPLRDPSGSATPQSAKLPEAFLLPQLPLPGRLHVGAILVLVLIIAAIFWGRTRSSFVVGVFGVNPSLAARLGLTPQRAIVVTILVSGAAAGLAGWMQLTGVDGRLQPGVSAGIGFAGLAVAVLGRNNPIGILIAAIVYASLSTGASGIQVATGTTPAAIGTITQGVLLLAAALTLAADATLRLRAARARTTA